MLLRIEGKEFFLFSDFFLLQIFNFIMYLQLGQSSVKLAWYILFICLPCAQFDSGKNRRKSTKSISSDSNANTECVHSFEHIMRWLLLMVSFESTGMPNETPFQCVKRKTITQTISVGFYDCSHDSCMFATRK